MVCWGPGCRSRALLSRHRIFASDSLSVSPKISAMGKVGLDGFSSVKVVAGAITSTSDKILVASGLIFISFLLLLFTFGVLTTALLLFMFMSDILAISVCKKFANL